MAATRLRARVILLVAAGPQRSLLRLLGWVPLHLRLLWLAAP